MLKYDKVYFCGYAKLPSVLATTSANGMLTLGLQIELETGIITGVSVTLLTEFAASLVREYFLNKHVLDDAESINEQITYCHQGNAQKSILKAYSDIRRSYVEYMEKNIDFLKK